MNKLHFKLISNKSEVINEEVEYFKRDNLVNFKIGDDIYQYNEKLHTLLKKDQEKHILIDTEKKVIIISLLAENITVDYKVDQCSVKTEDNIVKIEYTLESEDSINNLIIIEF